METSNGITSARRKQTDESKVRKKKDPIKCPLCPKKTTSDLHLIVHFAARHNRKTSIRGQTENEGSTQWVSLSAVMFHIKKISKVNIR